ncbi:cell envelope integrity protein CreD [Teredinibacter turnerae]|uniref:cell envelope integrity protein CreD n=1 Tax=Teredinibacter turnerae TaxID=2426 RepID=UPI00036F9E0B|nr:cell envelope integrity protein CreD [Teredinibacter turnerae]
MQTQRETKYCAQTRLAIKAGVILILSLCLLIPLSMIRGQINERGNYLQEVKRDIASSWTGNQTLLTPVLVQPYTTQPASGDSLPKTRYTLVPLLESQLLVDATVEMRARGIYRVPVYTADLVISGRIDRVHWARSIKDLLAKKNVTSVLPAYIAVGVSDQRGIDNNIGVQVGEQSVKATPGTGIADYEGGFSFLLPQAQNQDELTAIATTLTGPKHVNAIAQHSNAEKDQFVVNFAMRGTSSLRLIPTASSLNVRLHSRWPHPKFHGAFLPREKNITPQGFSAAWRVNGFNANSEQRLQSCNDSGCKALADTGFGVELFQPVDAYLQTERALKYGILFIAICFVAFFTFETVGAINIHPIQYALVGVTLAIFYLLLLALAEHIPFYAAYTIAAGSCCLLLLEYLSAMLGRRRAAIFCGCLVVLYAKLYVILQMEDFALLMGSLLMFALLALLMITTRNIRWHQAADQKASALVPTAR